MVKDQKFLHIIQIIASEVFDCVIEGMPYYEEETF